ncbi:uncharacterized protein CPUR_08807 [Claviceps purpurea 20.1]|uniref:Uncharacterized protein n=1 Tax=Claviceps purpurea (strain 20.1) TaxID=1111077 RepID=M1WGU9_CLAP2|nr:uncharacterized protein CPUR_08807 [Claviceps purpurea 20.1]
MSSSSTSSSPRPSRATQPSCAQLDASYNPARLASRNTSENENSDSSVSRLLRQEANDNDTVVNSDGDSGRGAEDDLETAPRRRRPRVKCTYRVAATTVSSASWSRAWITTLQTSMSQIYA